MAVEAGISKFKKNNLKIYIFVLIGFAIWCIYDGYFNDKWIKEHTDSDGNPKTYLVFNRKVPPYLIGAGVLLGVYMFVIRNRKVIADENELIIAGKERIAYDCIQRIDKTHFDSKGYFIITHTGKGGREINRKLSDRTYGNLGAVLEEIVVKIS